VEIGPIYDIYVPYCTLWRIGHWRLFQNPLQEDSCVVISKASSLQPRQPRWVVHKLSLPGAKVRGNESSSYR